jgi:hypothetical protein
MGIIWGSIWAYFSKRGLIIDRIFEGGNRTVLRAYFLEEPVNIISRFLPSSLMPEVARAPVVRMIRHGAPPFGAVAVLVRGGVGATAPTISSQHNPDLPARPGDFQKSPIHNWKILKKVRVTS